MVTTWENYLTRSDAARAHCDCHLRCGRAFENQRDCIRRIFETTRPKVVACLGAGVLNDLPYRAFVESGATIHLVDWLPGVVESGVAHSIIRHTGSDPPQCVYCLCPEADVRAYCRNYRKSRTSAQGVCKRFVPDTREPLTCLAFQKGDLPFIYRQDVTGGYASAFGRGVCGEVRTVTSWRQAFRRAGALANRVKRQRTTMDIPDASVDLVTSSMVVSQFEHEPYEYFSKQAAAVLGPPSPGEKNRLRPAMEALRSTLLANQIERHLDEIERILAPGGHCFMAFEMFHVEEGTGRWFLVREMHGALAAIARRFDFNFDILPHSDSVALFETPGGRSVVQRFVLEPRPK